MGRRITPPGLSGKLQGPQLQCLPKVKEDLS